MKATSIRPHWWEGLDAEGLMCGLLSLSESASGLGAHSIKCAVRTNVHIKNSMATLGSPLADSQRTLCNCFMT